MSADFGFRLDLYIDWHEELRRTRWPLMIGLVMVAGVVLVIAGLA